MCESMCMNRWMGPQASSTYSMTLLYFKYILTLETLQSDCGLQPGVKCRRQTEDFWTKSCNNFHHWELPIHVNRLMGMLFRLTWVVFKLTPVIFSPTGVIFRPTGMQTFTVISQNNPVYGYGCIRLCKYFHTSDLKDAAGFTIAWSFVTIYDVWECDNELVAHGLPYLEILKGW